MDSSQISLDTIPNGIFSQLDMFLSGNSPILIPLLLLLIIYSFKYFFGRDFSKKSFAEFFLEFPVDFGFIGITFVISYHFIDKEKVDFGIVMILCSILVSIINSLLRRWAQKEFYMDKTEMKDYLVFWLVGTINLAISMIFVWYVTNSIN